MQDQARWLRQELGQSLTGFQDLMLTTFSTVRDGIDGQVRGFGERLDAGIRAIDERAASIAAKLNDDMAQMRSEANANREQLRAVIEQRLDQNIRQQAETSKSLRDEPGGFFQRDLANIGRIDGPSRIRSGILRLDSLETGAANETARVTFLPCSLTSSTVSGPLPLAEAALLSLNAHRAAAASEMCQPNRSGTSIFLWRFNPISVLLQFPDPVR